MPPPPSPEPSGMLLLGGRHYNSEDFNTAGRTIKTGLIAVDVVSHW